MQVRYRSSGGDGGARIASVAGKMRGLRDETLRLDFISIL